MSIIVWLLSIVAYIGYHIYLVRRPSDLILGLGLAALILGFISFLANKKYLLILAFLLLFAGVIITYPSAFGRNQLWFWVGGLAVIIFLGSLSLRDD